MTSNGQTAAIETDRATVRNGSVVSFQNKEASVSFSSVDPKIRKVK